MVTTPAKGGAMDAPASGVADAADLAMVTTPAKGGAMDAPASGSISRLATALVASTRNGRILAVTQV
ncbi:MAG: hypothetical protein HY816_00710 [Candidatus Wallbacteria bacterium]|nr:hypothetical protein [Candidatus Wallbacteria bacterium]